MPFLQNIFVFRDGERPCLVSLHRTSEVIEVVPTHLDKVGLDPVNEMRAWEQRLEKEEVIRAQQTKTIRQSLAAASPFAVAEDTKKKEDRRV